MSTMSAMPAEESDPAGQGWRAWLRLAFAADGDGATRLVERRHQGPLVVQRAFHPEGPAVPHVYILHPPGGVVGGDDLHLQVACGPGAHALLTTPAATKAYRTAGLPAAIRQAFTVQAGGWLEWLPQETILHDGTDATLSTEVRLQDGAGFVGAEILCFGLPARGETFATGRCRQRLEIWRDSRAGSMPVLLERASFDAEDPVHGAAWGLAHARVTGLLAIVPAPGGSGALESARARAVDVARIPGDSAGVTVLHGGGALVARYAGGSAERAREFLHGVWSDLRPLAIGRPAVAPRVWAT
jgi:urease accessory protein